MRIRREIEEEIKRWPGKRNKILIEILLDIREFLIIGINRMTPSGDDLLCVKCGKPMLHVRLSKNGDVVELDPTGFYYCPQCDVKKS